MISSAPKPANRLSLQFLRAKIVQIERKINKLA